MFVVNPCAPAISDQIVARLLQTSVGTIGHIRETGFMDCGIIGRARGCKVAGTAVTVRLTVPDSAIAHYALKLVRPGDLLVIERGADQNVACWGGTSSAAAAKLGVRGVVIDGAGHDVHLAAAAGLPIWCRRITPITTKHRGLGGSLNVPVSCGGVIVNPGDAILADDNGVVVISPSELETVVEQAIAFDQKKAALIRMIAEDDSFVFPDASGATRIVEEALEHQG